MPILRVGLVCYSKYSATRSSFISMRAGYGKVKNAISASSIKWRGRSYAASAPSEMPNTPKVRRRLSRDERKAMVLSFVNKYKVSNEGRFPSISVTHKEVGGGYYFVKNILEEIVVQSKLSCSNVERESLLGKNQRHKEVSLDGADFIKREIARMPDVPREEASGNEQTDKQVGADKRLQDSGCTQKTSSRRTVELKSLHDPSVSVETQRNLLKEDPKDISHPCLEEKVVDTVVIEAYGLEKGNLQRPKDGGKIDTEKVSDARFKSTDSEVRSLSESLLDSDNINLTHQQQEEAVSELLQQKYGSEQYQDSSGLEIVSPKNAGVEVERASGELLGFKDNTPQHNAQLCQNARGTEEFPRDISEGQTDDTKKSTLWGNFKSFAEGIINVWKKL